MHNMCIVPVPLKYSAAELPDTCNIVHVYYVPLGVFATQVVIMMPLFRLNWRKDLEGVGLKCLVSDGSDDPVS
jgi:hypothetical protein